MKAPVDGAPIRVLLIDDDRDDYIITLRLFEALPGHRFELDWVPSYEEGLDSICREAGIEVGVFTSPHLVSITERVRINGVDISDEEFARIANLVREKRTHEIDVVIETGMESGMIDLNHSLLELVRSGEISIETAEQFSFNPKGLERMM